MYTASIASILDVANQIGSQGAYHCTKYWCKLINSKISVGGVDGELTEKVFNKLFNRWYP